MLRCIIHLVPEFYEGKLTGVVWEDILKCSIGEVSKKVSSVFQDPRGQFFTVNSTTAVAFGLENTGLSHGEIVRKTDEIFRRFGLEKLRGRSVFMLSSGERQLIAILSVMVMDTDTILLDEPTANLDTAAIKRLSRLLMDIKETGKTLVISEHRLYFLKDLADEYWYMKNGKIRRKYSAAEFGRLSEKELDELGLRSTDLDGILPQRSQQNQDHAAEDVFEIRGLSFGYDSDNTILSDVSYKCRTGSVTGVIGANGSGKTTFGKCISGLLKAGKGEYSFNGVPIKQQEMTEKSMLVMQESEFQFFSNSVMNEIKNAWKNDASMELQVEQILKKMNLWACRNRHPFSLSGGQMQKLTLILAYFSRKKIVVLDEPTAGMDRRSLKACAALIKEMAKTRMIFIITHDIELIARVCTDCISIREGEINHRFVLDGDGAFARLRDYMKRSFSLGDNVRKIAKQAARVFTDIRVYLAYLIVSLVFCFAGNTLIHGAITTGLLILALVNRQFRQIVTYVPVFILLAAVPWITKALLLNIISNFFLRFIPVGMAIDMLFAGDGASKLIAAMRKMRVSEKAILILSVIFWFFPVIRNDIKIAMQALRTRSFFPNPSDKIKRIPAYVEMLMVPMMFRVIRIAEFLSASAETRGISLECRKHSYIDCKMTAQDYEFFLSLWRFIKL